MPNWKKVITSGSNAALNSLTVTSGITGTLTGNASTATSATSATTATNANNINISATTSADTATSVVLVANQSTGNQSPFIDSGLTYNANTNALTATTFVGALTGNASTATSATTATNATNATNVAVTNTTTGTGPYYLMFADGTTGNRATRVDSSTLTFNATTNTLTVANLAGNASTATTATTATNATNVNTGLVTTNATHYIPFVNSNNNPASAEALGTVGTLTYNPSIGQFGATRIVATSITGSLQGSISGTATTAATASLSLSAAPFSVTAVAMLTGGSSDNGKVLIGSTGSGMTLAGLTAGSGISITSGSGAITITSTAGGGTVTSVATAGTVSGINLTGGPITGAGTITLGGSISGLTTSNLSSSAGITNAQLANSAITIAGTSTSLGGSITRAQILAGSGIFSGSAQITGLTNSNLSGAAGITNANLANSAVTVGSTSIALGASATTITGLSSVTSTSFVGALTGNASTATSATSATTATNATNVAVTNTTTGTGPYYLMFADGTTGNRASRVDSSTLTFNATTNTLTVANLAGNATSATTANATTAALTAGTYLTSGGTFNGSTARTFAVDATSANTVSKVVARDSSGNFSAGTITATLSGNASTATSASFATTTNNANLVNITTQNTTPVTYNVTFTGGTSGYNNLNVDASTLTYNPSTTTLSTGTVVANLTGNASTATYATSAGSAGSAGVVSGIASPSITFLGGHGNLSSTEALSTSRNGELYWEPAAQAIVVQDVLGTGARTLFGTLLGASGEGFLEAQGGRMYYYADKHIFGNNAYGYSGQFNGDDFDAGGDITCGGTKFFDIAHQTKQGWGLKHAAIEGPESGVYFRGKLSGSDKIELPEYWKWLVHEDTITVTLTPVGQYQALYVKDIKDNEVYIGSDGDFVNCHYVVYGERKDVDRWDVEYENYSRNEK
jgi:hypothetical protein